MLDPAQQKTPTRDLVFGHNPEARHRFSFLPPPCRHTVTTGYSMNKTLVPSTGNAGSGDAHTRADGAKPSSAADTSNASMVMSSSSLIAAMSAFSLVKR